MICIAPSMVVAFMSTIFSLAISRTWSSVIWPRNFLARQFRTALQLRRLFQVMRDGRFGVDEGKTAVGINRNFGRQQHADFHLRGLRIKRLAEFHDVGAGLAERGTNGGGRVGFASRHVELDHTINLFCHDYLLVAEGVVRRMAASSTRLAGL